MKSGCVFIGFLLICLVSSCSKRAAFNETNSSGALFHKTEQTRLSPPEENKYLVTKDMVWHYLLGFDCYRDSIVSIVSYPSELNSILYLVSFNDGWKIMPSDSRFGIVLVESENGALDLLQEFENEHFKAWLTDMMKQIEEARSVLDSFGDESAAFWDTFRTRSKASILAEIKEGQMTLTRSLDPGEPIWGKLLVSTSTSSIIIGNKDHLLQTKWGQGPPWNTTLPTVDSLNSLAGCVAVSAAQVLHYYHNSSGVPSGLYHSIVLSQYNSNKVYDLYDAYNVHHYGYYQKGTLTRTNYVYNSPHWSNMPLTNSGGTDEQYRYVSDLLLDVGVRLGMYYSPWASTITVGQNSYFDITPCFSSANWTQYQSETDKQTVLTGLDMDDPTIITAQGEENGSPVGHSWVIDGYQKKRHFVTKNYEWYPLDEIPDDALICDLKNEDYLLSIYPNLYSGMPVVDYLDYNEEYFRMNWGWNGMGDSYLYSSYPSYSWQGIYSSYKGIHYHLLPGELLIQ